MTKKIIFTAGFVFSISFLMAQGKVTAISGSKGPVIEHAVAAKESLYSLSRKYNVKVSDLASANGFDKDKNLVLGQKVKIPLSADNFNQQSQKGTPIYYEVGEKEGLMTVSNKFNKVALKNLRTWNNLKKDELSKGKTLIVGYLSKAEGGEEKAEETKKLEKVGVEKSNVDKKEDKTGTTKKDDKTKTDKAVANKVVKPKTEKPAEAVAKDHVKPTTTSKKDDKIEDLVSDKLAAKKEAETSKEEPIDETGYYKKIYMAQTDSSLATQRTFSSGIFKTNKGWNDRKYYLLMDNVAAGTVVKVMNPGNNAVVYAKVLGEIKGTQQHDNPEIRISDAAAAVLKITGTDRFQVNITY